MTRICSNNNASAEVLKTARQRRCFTSRFFLTPSSVLRPSLWGARFRVRAGFAALAALGYLENLARILQKLVAPQIILRLSDLIFIANLWNRSATGALHYNLKFLFRCPLSFFHWFVSSFLTGYSQTNRFVLAGCSIKTTKLLLEKVQEVVLLYEEEGNTKAAENFNEIKQELFKHWKLSH